MSNKNRILLIAGLMGGLALAGTALAQTTPTGQPGMGYGRMGGRMMGAMHRNGVFGTVASISGNTLTITSQNWSQDKTNTTSTTYTVDATNAKVMKNGAAATVSNIAVGDTVMVQGTVTGTSVVATMIRDGMMPKTNKEKTPVIQGNGQPVIAGKVTAISGNSITVANKNVTYTVDATNATINKNGAASTLSGVVVGDNVIVQGAVSGTNITASSIIDHEVPANTATNGSTKPHTGFFGGIGNFFRNLFGF